MSLKPTVHSIFHNGTNTVCYVVSDETTKKCAIIDPVSDFDRDSGSITYVHARQVIDYVKQNGLVVEYILETHTHADHITGACYLKELLGGKICIGEHVTVVQKIFSEKFNFNDFPCDGSQFDVLFKDGDKFQIGSLEATVFHTPGHTPSCLSYLIGDAVFTGDTVFMPDVGTARCDFPNGCASQLFHSVKKLYTLPDETRMFVGHDYSVNGRANIWETTIGEQKKTNKHLTACTSLEEFVKVRVERDKTLKVPALMFPSIQININAGQLDHTANENGVYTLRIPLTIDDRL